MKKIKQVWKDAPKDDLNKKLIITALSLCIFSLTIAVFYPIFLFKIMFFNSIVLISIILYNTYLCIKLFRKNYKENTDENDQNNR